MSLAASPVAVAVAGLLNVSSLTTLASLTDDPAQGSTFPFVWPEVFDESDIRGFGTGALSEIELRVHVFSQYEGAKEAQAIASQVITLLKDQSLTVTGWTQCGRIFYDRTVALTDEAINGIKCRELVVFFRIYVESA